MKSSYRDSLDALNQAINKEFKRAEESKLHKVLRVRLSMTKSSNGLDVCSVQVECRAGCGHLIRAFGEEASDLRRHAIMLEPTLAVHSE